jgi:multicomponent Na+:H+ antiporter subunit F
MILAAREAVVATANVMLVVLAVAMLMAVFRVVRGPSLPDRVVAMDVIAILIVGMTGLYAIRESNAVFLRVAMLVALINFVGTVAFAYYLQRRVMQ